MWVFCHYMRVFSAATTGFTRQIYDFISDGYRPILTAILIPRLALARVMVSVVSVSVFIRNPFELAVHFLLRILRSRDPAIDWPKPGIAVLCTSWALPSFTIPLI